jgi:hypothetical protein
MLELEKWPIMVLSSLAQKMTDETPWTSSLVQFWSKMPFNMQA